MKIIRLLDSGTGNVHVKFENKIPKKTEVMLHISSGGQTDGHMDRCKGKVNLVYPHQLRWAGYNDDYPHVIIA